MKGIWDHELKTESEYYKAIVSGDKNFEIRKNDRNFQVGELLKLNEIAVNRYTGESTTRVITYMTDFQQKEGYVVLSIAI